MGSISRQQLVTLINRIDLTGKTVLDVGCGPEKYHARNWTRGKPKEYDTTDINDEFKPTYVFDLNEVHFLPKSYDVVLCFETLEHVWNPVIALDNLVRYTAEGGTLYISTPFINPIHDTHDYLRFTDEWYQKALEQYEPKEVNIIPRTATKGEDTLLQFFNEEGLRMSKIRLKKGEAHKLPVIGYFVEVKL